MESRRLFLRQSILPYIRRKAFFIELGTAMLAFLFGRIAIFDGLFPFGMALFVALDMAGFNIYYPLTGVLAGALLVWPEGQVALSGCLLYLLARTCMHFIHRRVTRLDKLLSLSLAQLLLLPIFYLSSFPVFLRGMANFALVMLLCILFQNSLRAMRGLSVRKKLMEEEQVAVCMLLGALALSVSEVSIYAFSLAIVLVAWVAIFLAYAKGLAAVAAGVALAGMLVLGEQAHPLLLADIAACTLLAVLFRRTGNAYGAAAAFFICGSITERYFGIPGQHIGVANALPAALCVAFLPKRAMLWLRAIVDTSAREERTARAVLKRVQLRASEDIHQAAVTVDSMAALFPAEPVWMYDAAAEQQEMQKAAMHVCVDCMRRGGCWRAPQETMEVVAEMIQVYAAGQKPWPQSPVHSDCSRATFIAAAASAAQDFYRKQCTLQYRQEEEQAFAHRQLNDLGRVMDILGADIAETVWPDEALAQIYTKKLEQEGLPLRSILVQRQKDGLQLELRVHTSTHSNIQIEEMVSQVTERPMRMLRAENYTRHRVFLFEEAQRFQAASGAATSAMPGNTVSGDSTAYCHLKKGRSLFALSDGMGSGAIAREKSREALRLLVRLYQVGLARDAAMECVNRLLMGKGKEDMYATLDALYINLATGEAEFIKFGAPPSFVLRNGKVHTVYAEALPAGILQEAAPAINIATLRRNDAVVMLSDGALDALGEETIEEILRCVGGANTCKDAAEDLLRAAQERNTADDMTVQVVRIE